MILGDDGSERVQLHIELMSPGKENFKGGRPLFLPENQSAAHSLMFFINLITPH